MSDVFISYSRHNSDFARRLIDKLILRGKDAWVDWEGIPLTSPNWWMEIKAGVEAADSFVFIMSPDSMASVVCNMELDYALELHKRIGFLPGELNLWKNLTGAQVVDYLGKVRGGVDMNNVQALTKRLELDLSIRIRSYSTGNKRKLGLVLAMMNKPDLLILDEPTSGLDPLMQQTFNELMLEAQKSGQTVFLSSHMLGEVQTICDRVGILRGGELKAVESVSNLTHANFRWVTLRLREPVATTQLSSLKGVSEVSAVDGGLKLRLVGDFDPLLRALSPYYVQNLEVAEPTLEEIFLSFYGGNGQTQKERVS